MTTFSYKLFAQGGPVMWLLVIVGIVALAIFVERALFLHRGQIRSTEFLQGIRNLLQKGRLKAALRHARDDEPALRYAVQEAALTELPILERRIGSLAAIAQIAPLLGLLGTLLGMIQTFWLFNQGGNYATPEALTRGLWPALLTAAAGLAVAVPTHLARHFLNGRVRALVQDMEWVANEIMRYLLTDYRLGAASAAEENK
jgi:biopolymer transport protein ExbB